MGSSDDPSPSPGADDLFLYLSDLGPTSPFAYLDPSSPSDYLDLPPTPQPQPGNIGPAQDMLLPYISSMLMEDDIDDTFFCDYPDNPALLQAQQSFLDALSDDASSPTTTTTPTNSSASASLNHFSSSSDASASAAVDSYAPAPAAQFDGFDLDPAAFFSNGANSDLMSSAFLKGMEEANKFLPDDPKRFVLPTPTPAADKVAPGFNSAAAATVPAAVAVAVKEEEVVLAAPGRGRRNRFDDDEDLELQRRSSKQSALQGDGDERDVFEKYILTSHETCVEEMQKLRIAMQEEAAKKEAAGNQGKFYRR